MLNFSKILVKVSAVALAAQLPLAHAAVQSHSVTNNELTLTLADNDQRVTEADIATIGASVITGAAKIKIDLAASTSTTNYKRLVFVFEDLAACSLANAGGVVEFPNLTEIDASLAFFPDELTVAETPSQSRTDTKYATVKDSAQPDKLGKCYRSAWK